MNFNIHLLFLLLSLLLLSFFFFFFFFGGGGSQKIESLWRMQILWILFGGHHKTRLFLGSFLCIYMSFLSSMYRTGIFFVGCLFVVVVVVVVLGGGG